MVWGKLMRYLKKSALWWMDIEAWKCGETEIQNRSKVPLGVIDGKGINAVFPGGEVKDKLPGD